MTKKEKKELFLKVTERLKKIYPDAVCALEFGGDPWKLLVMGRLSAQCTDARVNIVCRELFMEFPTAFDMANGDIKRIEEIVRPCGLFHTKAKNIKDSSAMLVKEYGGELPVEMDELLKFPGVGRKIANLLRGDIFSLPAVVADTHCIRICGRLGAYSEGVKDAHKVERIMSEILPENEQSDFCHRIVQFGRDICTARRPQCEACILSDICMHSKKKSKFC